MSSEDLSRAFDRFWRASGESEGSGLGRALVRRLVAADGGEVELRPGTMAGIDAVVRLRLGARQRRVPAGSRQEPAPQHLGLLTVCPNPNRHRGAHRSPRSLRGRF